MNPIFSALFFVFLAINISFSQETGTLLIVSMNDCTIVIDGMEEHTLSKGKPLVVSLGEGQHFLQRKDSEYSQVIEIEANKQVVCQLKSEEESATDTEANQSFKRDVQVEVVADLSLSIPGGFSLGAHALNGGDYESSGVPIFLYYFQKGDKIQIDIQMLNKKGTNSIELYSYPDLNKVFSVYAFENLQNKEIDIFRDGIYVIEIGTNYAFDRNVTFKLTRSIGNPDEYKSFRVEKRRSYELKSIQEPITSWVNSTSNETWKGGKSKIVFPINLPPNTLEWYYVFTASRSAEETKAVMNNVDLFGELGNVVLGLSGPVLGLGLDIITAPPGSNYCDVFLLDQTNSILFQQDQQFRHWVEGSRGNVTSGKIKIANQYGSPLYVGVRNTDSFHGISVGIEIVALTFSEFYSQVDEE